MDKKNKKILAIVFATIFLDLVGFGIILPILPYLADQFQASETEIGLLMAIYSLMQFLCSPWWGKLSDRIGRRPVILVSLFGMGLSYVVFAYSQTIAMLFVARACAGFFASNISSAQAIIADITPRDKRSIGMGLIGAAFGLGFIVGPVIGALTSELGLKLGSTAPFGIQFASIVAAALSGLTFLFAFFMLPETFKKDRRNDNSESSKKSMSLAKIVSQKKLFPLVLVFFLVSLAMALMEVMLFVFVKDRFDWTQAQAGYGFAYVGIIMVLTQGYFIRKWLPKFGEKKVLIGGLLLMGLGLAGIAPSHSISMLAIAMTALALGHGCLRPPLMGLASGAAGATDQGAVMGVMQSMSAIGRIVGPPLGGWAYQACSDGAPFWAAALLTGVAFVIFIKVSASLESSVA